MEGSREKPNKSLSSWNNAESVNPDRPFSAMGSAVFHLDSSAPQMTSPSSSHRHPPSTAGAVPNRSTGGVIEGEFDVRKFLLDQKSSQPFHKSSLFRVSTFAKQVASMEPESSNQSTRSKLKRVVLPRMELGSSKSTGNLPGTKPRSRTSRNQSDCEDNPSISHYYSIEKMSASCFHATQNKNKTWLFLPGSDERSKTSKGGGKSSITGVDRPSRRVDVLDLERCFDTAIQFASKNKHMDVACEEKLSMLDQDFMAIYARIIQRYGSAASSESSSDSRKILTKLLFEQKWSDVVIGELESMLTVSFLEQGVVLRKARILYAKAFFQLENLYKSQWQDLIQEKEEVEYLREEVRRSDEHHKQDAQSMKERYETEIDKLKTTFESEKSDMERRLADSKEQITKMGDAMKTLNAIFRQMREDTEKVKAVELRENYGRLEHKYEQCREEIEQLRPVIQEKQQLQSKFDELSRDRDALKDQITELTNLVHTKDTVIASLMEQQSNLIAAQELKAAREEEMRRQAEEEKEDERDGALTITRDSNGPATGVCVRCKQDLRTISANEGKADGNKGPESTNSPVTNETEAFKLPKKRRIQCLYFRILLPNLGGRRPQREISWTLSCMRSILFAKQIDDSMCKRTAGLFPLRIRMPEFVYAWFAPWKSLKEEKSIAGVESLDGDAEADIIDDPNDPDASQQQHIQANEDRWCLYYGVRSLVQQGYLEAKLFLSLLDEKFGEDEQVFMLHCYRVLDVLLEGRMNWGPLRDKLSYEVFAREYAALIGDSSATAETSVPPRMRVPKTIWISRYHASLATSVVLSKATETEREALDNKILEYVVTNVPEDERPEIYLEPKIQSEEANTQKRPKSGRCGEINDETIDGNLQEPLHFVDANLWVELMMLEYKEEQAHRRAAIRLMFQTATSAAAAASDSVAEMSLSAMLGINYASMDMEQFRAMVHTLNDEIPSFMVATLFRNAYTRGNGTVNFDSFMDAAEAAQFFSTCMRLESPSSVVSRIFGHPFSRSPVLMTPSSRAAFIVSRFFAILGNDISSTIEQLPLWTRSMTDSLAYEISSTLLEGGYSDGIRLLTLFQRLIDNLGVAKLIRRETTGCLFSSSDLHNIEKALTGLLDFARQREKSSVELLIDAVRQKLSVRRVQMKFRRRLKQDQGAPLVMRTLMHRRYGSGPLNYRQRRAERPVIWLRLVISLILRQSMQSTHISAVLGELSSISGAFHAGRSSPLQLTVSSSLNGGIGPTPKPVFVELIYDFFLERLGARCEAERMIHDVFANCRSLVRTDSLALLFSHLCCMSNSCPEDRLLGQNEALAFLHAIFRCGLHSFRIINPSGELQSDADTSPEVDQTDFVAIDVVENILQTAFSKLSADQKSRLKGRITDAATDIKSSEMEANVFLVLALNEWRRYILYRLNEIRVTCCEVEAELVHFEELLQLETLTTILQKTDITFTSEDLCIILRRLYITEKTLTKSSDNDGGDTTSLALKPDPMSDRIAAACYPLIAKEAMSGLQKLAPRRFEIKPSPLQSYEFLVSTWEDYQETCRELLDELRETGKNKDIHATVQHRSPMVIGDGDGGGLHYLSSSNTVSSQDADQLEIVHVRFLERLQQLTEVFDNNAQEKNSHRDVSLHLIDAQVNETWKIFRQMFVGFVKLQAAAGLGDGPLPDQWDRHSE
ncbi:hypothetical protein L917_01524 [Phytophthora nicotianae]|uniref:Uncharacterized protein n=1 Tax=Phytophthora nicotianae TaxID=4792 RepID=W2LWQ3_PHYNI|nr:hypothetical protein L917_01524 [Phytophthora nicotianae]